MPRAASEDRRAVGAPAAWLSAVWTGVGAAAVGAVLSIAVVAVCWLPAAGARANANSAVRAGMLAFLAALHGGITVDGLDAAFVPLGMTLAVAAIAWRAGSRLAGLTAELEVRALVWTGAAQVAAFAAGCAVTARFATLGTSSVSALSAGVAGAVLFAATGGVAFVRGSALRTEIQVPPWLPGAGRAAAAGVLVYLAGAALLVGGAVVVHAHRVEEISRQVGGGWQGAPVLLLGVLAAPNAVVAGASYLAGPGFAVGSGSTAGVTSTLHGTLPAFPILGALPSGHGATVPVWLLVVATPVLAGATAARSACTAPGWAQRWQAIGAGSIGAGVLGAVLAWLGGGAIGSGRLHVVGASPWQLGLAWAVEIATVAAAVLGVLAAVAAVRARSAEPVPEPEPLGLRARLTAVRDSVVDSVKDTVKLVTTSTGDEPEATAKGDAERGDQLAG